MTRPTARMFLSLALVAALLVVVPVAGAEPQGRGATPQLTKCGAFKKKAPRQRCLKQNQANRIAFNQIKDSSFVGKRGDGQYVEHFFCAGGKYETRTESSAGTGVGGGTSWRVKDAVVKRGGKWIDAVVTSASRMEIGVLRRGDKWQVAVASLGRMLYPGDVVKTKATEDCVAS